MGVPGCWAARNTPTPNQLLPEIPPNELSEIRYLSGAEILQLPDVPAGFSCYPVIVIYMITPGAGSGPSPHP